MVTTAGITRVTRSSSESVVAAAGASGGGGVAARLSGTGSASGAVLVDAGAGAGCTAVDIVAGAAIADGEAGCRLLIHQTVVAIATAATPINPAIWMKIDPADVRRSVISVLSGSAEEGFRLQAPDSGPEPKARSPEPA